MQLQLLGFEKATVPGTYKLTFDYGGDQFDTQASVCQGIVEYVNYDDKLQRILHQNVGDAKQMNSTIFKIHQHQSIEMPSMIGDF